MTTKKTEMGPTTRLAYQCIEDNLLMNQNRLAPDDVLEYLLDDYNFKHLNELLKETMVKAHLPRDTDKLLPTYASMESFLKNLRENKLQSAPLKEPEFVRDCEAGEVTNTALEPSRHPDRIGKVGTEFLKEEDSDTCFQKVLLSLLAKQDEECVYGKRKKPWKKDLIKRWIPNKSSSGSSPQSSDSIRNRYDAIPICFALGLNYEESCTFLNKAGHTVLQVRNPEDAIYIYCILKHRPYHVATKLIHDYYALEEKSTASDHAKETDAPSGNTTPGNTTSGNTTSGNTTPGNTTSGNTTQFLQESLIKGSSWESDEDFFNTFLIPNRSLFLRYSQTAFLEFLKLKIPVYFFVLERIIREESNWYNKLKEEKYEAQHNSSSIASKKAWKETKTTDTFLATLKEYAKLLELFDQADKKVRVTLQSDGEIHSRNNSLDVVDFLIENYPSYMSDPVSMEIISSFLSDILSPNKVLRIWVPIMGNDSKDGEYFVKIDGKKVILTDEDKISHAYDDLPWETYDNRQKGTTSSSLKETVLKNFPGRTHLSKMNHPKSFADNLSTRKAILLFFYLNFTHDYYMKTDGVYTAMAGGRNFDLASFMDTLNDLLERCQMGTLYLANQYDWLIVLSARKLEVDACFEYFDSRFSNPADFLDEVLSLSYPLDEEV